MKKLNIKAIVLGALADIGGSIAFGMIMGATIGVYYVASHGSMDGFETFYQSSVPVMAMSILIGLIFVSLGGLVAGKIAKGNEIFNALSVGVVSLAFGALFFCQLSLVV